MKICLSLTKGTILIFNCLAYFFQNLNEYLPIVGFLCLICQISIGRLLGNKLKLNLHIILLFYLSNRKMFNKIWFHDLWCFCLKYNLVMLYFCSSFSAYNIHDDKMPQWRAPSSIFCHVRTNFCKAFNPLKMTSECACILDKIGSKIWQVFVH